MTEEPTCDLPTAETGFTARDYRDLRQQLERAVVTRNEKATRAILSNNVNTILGALQDAVADKWQPIETMPCYRYAMVGRWCCGARDRGYWHEIRANWNVFGEGCGELTGKKSWSYESPDRPSPFYDDEGNYAEPTHWCSIPEPPAP